MKKTISLVLVLALGLAAEVAKADFVFGAPTNLGPTVNRGPAVNTSANETVPFISADRLQLYFSTWDVHRPGGYGGGDIWVATRETTNDPWEEPVNLGPTVNSSSGDGGVCIPADGLSLFFGSDRPGGYGGIDIWVTTRATTDDDWGIPVNLGPNVNSSAGEAGPSISADGLQIYFMDFGIRRPGGYGGIDIWVTTRTTRDDAWGVPVNLGPTVNSSAHDKTASISADGLALFFCSTRPGGYGAGDLWVTTRETMEDDWGTPVNLGSTINTSAWDDLPGISADGLSLYFSSNRLGGLGYDLYVATRESVSDPFGQPINLSSVDAGPSISADGLSLFFHSTRPGGFGSFDIWVTTRETTDDEWAAPVNLGPTVNSSSNELTPSFSADGLSLFFGSDQPGGFGEPDLWVATRATTEDDWGTPVNLGPTVNSSGWDLCPNISADGLSLFFTSYDRPGGYGDWDIWVTTRTTKNNDWGTPVNLGHSVNSSSNELRPNISADGRTLFLSSDRPGGSGGYDIWVNTRSHTGADWGVPVNLGPTVNSSTWDQAPALSADGSTLYFASDRPGGFGSADLWQVPIDLVVDFNADGIVDSADICIMVDYWHTDEPLCDIGPLPWGDGIVDVQDLIVLAEHLFEEVDDPTLIAHWALDEAEGIIAQDSVGNNDAFIIGDPVWQPSGGMVDGAIQLDGVGDYVSTDFVLNPAEGAFSAFAWIKGGAPGQVVLSQMGGARWLCTDLSEGNLITELKGTGRGATELLSQTIITDGNWHRIGLVWNGSHRTLYVDDVAVAEDEQAGLEGSENGLYIGTGKTLDAASFFSGLIDDVRIYNRVVIP